MKKQYSVPPPPGVTPRGDPEKAYVDGTGPRGDAFHLASSSIAPRLQLFDTALSTALGLFIVFVAGVAYIVWYKARVLDKIEAAFQPGYDPALELADNKRRGKKGSFPDDHMRRREQDLVDSIFHGKEGGHYFLIMGPKGTGKGTMIIDAMRAIDADGTALCEAHPDLEVFRLRLGKAINFEYMEDSQTGLFQRRDEREGGAGLDIERAMNKLEKVALRLSREKGRPLVLVINNIHLFKNNEDAQKLLLQLQQRAESWAESRIMTMVFTSDDFWPFLMMKKNANRMQVLSVSDLDAEESFQILERLRHDCPLKSELESEATLKEVLTITGGRLSFLNRIAREPDMLDTANYMLQNEKAWLLSQIGLIPDCDDDVMDEQKWSSCSWLLLREFVNQRIEMERYLRDEAIASGSGTDEEWDELPMPSISYHRARQIMTRADFIEGLDHTNIISIDINLDVRPDSMLILQAAREIVEEEGFDEMLDGVRARVDEIESLHRTREITFKDVQQGERLKIEAGNGRLSFYKG